MKKVALILQMLLAGLLTGAQPKSVGDLKHLVSIAKPDTNKVVLLTHLSNAYTWTKPDSCIVFAQQGLTLASQIHFNKGEAALKSTMGTALWILGDYLQADKVLLEALDNAKSFNDTALILNLYKVISSNKRDKGDYRDALNYSFTGYALCKGCDHFKAKIGSIYLEMNNTDSALYYLKQGVPFGYTLWLLGKTYDKTGDIKKAYYYYRQSIADQVASNNNSKDLSNVYNSLAQLFKKEDKTDSCIFYAKKAYNTAHEVYYTKGMLETALLLSDIYENTNPQEALFYFKIAMAAKDSLFNLQKTTQFLNQQFNVQWQKQQEEVNKINYKNKIRTYTLLAVLSFLLFAGVILYRNSKRKQKAKMEIERAYEHLKSTQAQLIQSEKMASLGELTAGIAHEIQNPLNFVNNFSDINKELLEELKEEAGKGNIDEVKAIANDVINNEEKINHHGKRADSIVKGMLQHSRQTKGMKEPTDINALCDEYLRLSYHGLRAKDKSLNANIKTSFDESIGKINIVPQDIGRVLLNLFNNAFYAVSEKKKLMADSYRPLVEIKTRRINNAVEIIISDNGNGISSNIIDKIFQPFFTTKPTGQGTGLGLSLAYDIITKEHKGTIKAESTAGEGSKFIINLPV